MNPVFDAETFRPMAHQQLRPDDFFQGLRREISLRQDLSLWGVFRRIVVPMIFARLSRRFPFLPGFHVFDTYVQSYTTHTDYKKFDDVLRMVLDCSIDQVKQLETLLQESHARGEIFYGIHRSPSALMTCIVEGLGDGEHIHFIDGSDGGYAMAAKELKRQAQRYMEKAG